MMMRKSSGRTRGITRGTVLLALAALASACSSKQAETAANTSADPAYLSVARIADKATLLAGESSSVNSLSAPAPNLGPKTLERHLEGDAEFEQSFIPGPDPVRPNLVGLGPVFNNSACRNCHVRDGRGTLPPILAGQTQTKLGPNESLLVRISIESSENASPKDAEHGWGAPVAVPGFSSQLFHRGIYGLRPDSPGTGQADVYFSYEKTSVSLSGGQTIVLRKPKFELKNAYDGPRSRLYQADVRTSPRMAPPMIGLGLLEAIPEDQILSRADPLDADGDGISGKPNFVLDLAKASAGDPHPISLGRFGWKGSAPSLRQQVVAALNGDMGMTSNWLPKQNIFGTPLYDIFLKLPGATDVSLPEIEAKDELVDDLTTYSQTLGVPERRKVQDLVVIQGGRLFQQLRCTSCHAGPYVLKGDPKIAEFKDLKIYPFTDMLLHDMGEGLADHRRDFDADGREWRTTPLWGIGITALVNPRAGFLHDGRARSLEEAILWHGGEASRAVSSFKELGANDRDALVSFLESL